MFAAANKISVNPLFLRHDLMIELGRLEMAMEDMRDADRIDQTRQQISQLETRRARINEALSRLPARSCPRTAAQAVPHKKPRYCAVFCG